MTRLSLVCIVFVLLQSAGLAADSPDVKSVIPSIEDMASEWLEVENLVQMPSLHNFHEMAACAPTLLGVNYNPGGRLFGWPVNGRWYDYQTLPLVKLLINGQTHESTTCRWYPYQAMRRSNVDGVNVETAVRMVFEGPGILYRIYLSNPTDKSATVDVLIEVPGKQINQDRYPNEVHVAFESQDPPLVMEHCFVQSPDQVSEEANSVSAAWQVTLAPGESQKLELAMAHTVEDSAASRSALPEAVHHLAHDFEQVWEQTKDKWSERWIQTFTPGNHHFSGNAPMLVTDDMKVRDIYYRSILTLLVLHRTNLAMCDRVFITSGEREKGYVFYWDTSMWSKIFALWEPEGMKKQLRMFLQADPHGGFVYNMDTGKQGDGWYAANDMTMFRLANSYLAVTGDAEFLKERVGKLTVLEHLEKLALGWQALQRDKSVMLADYGENENLLECAPMYINRVPSFNAANVWMMRIVANYYELEGNDTRAAELRHSADEIAQAVLKLYKPGDGVWYALHRDGKKVELRHCYDFVCVGEFMSPDLTEPMKQEMVDFVERELLADHWMRAMSPLDKAAEISDRPDHGPMGAFDAWPALTVSTMCQLGAWDEAIDFLRRTQDVLDEGVYGQAREFYGPNRLERDAPVRIALRGACMRECVGGGAFAEVILESLFGLQPAFGRPLELFEPDVNRGFAGTLYSIDFRGKMIEITSEPAGVRIVEP
jgi:hypothetical protein